MLASLQACVAEESVKYDNQIMAEQVTGGIDELQDLFALRLLSNSYYYDYLTNLRNEMTASTVSQWWWASMFLGKEIYSSPITKHVIMQLWGKVKSLPVGNPLIIPGLQSIVGLGVTGKEYWQTGANTSKFWTTFALLTNFATLHGYSWLMDSIIDVDKPDDIKSGLPHRYMNVKRYWDRMESQSTDITNNDDDTFVQQIAETMGSTIEDKFIYFSTNDGIPILEKTLNKDLFKHIHLPPGSLVKYKPEGKSLPLIMTIVDDCGDMYNNTNCTDTLKDIIQQQVTTDFIFEERAIHLGASYRIGYCINKGESYVIDVGAKNVANYFKASILWSMANYLNIFMFCPDWIGTAGSVGAALVDTVGAASPAVVGTFSVLAVIPTAKFGIPDISMFSLQLGKYLIDKGTYAIPKQINRTSDENPYGKNDYMK
jgi:hypothetical protein